MFFPEQIKTETLRTASVAVLISGGIESSFLVHALTEYFAKVYPIYVCFGLSWEKIEYQFLIEYLKSIKQPRIMQLTKLDMPVGDVYGKHWSTTSGGAPDAAAEDEAVCLPGRNLLLVPKAALWCALNNIHYLALGSLASNPFPDGQPEFFDQLQKTLNAGLGFDINLLTPVIKMHKPEVISLAKNLPLHLTFSCLNPTAQKAGDFIHCGACNKCTERQQAFMEAQVKDQTLYASRSSHQVAEAALAKKDYCRVSEQRS